MSDRLPCVSLRFLGVVGLCFIGGNVSVRENEEGGAGATVGG